MFVRKLEYAANHQVLYKIKHFNTSIISPIYKISQFDQILLGSLVKI